nr:MAG TPA: hypothetical protein [Caudoviricetes sp.]
MISRFNTLKNKRKIFLDFLNRFWYYNNSITERAARAAKGERHDC